MCKGSQGEEDWSKCFLLSWPVFYFPFFKKLLHNLLPTKKIHGQPKGGRKIHAPENCPPPPFKKTMACP